MLQQFDRRLPVYTNAMQEGFTINSIRTISSPSTYCLYIIQHYALLGGISIIIKLLNTMINTEKYRWIDKYNDITPANVPPWIHWNTSTEACNSDPYETINYQQIFNLTLISKVCNTYNCLSFQYVKLLDNTNLTDANNMLSVILKSKPLDRDSANEGGDVADANKSG